MTIDPTNLRLPSEPNEPDPMNTMIDCAFCGLESPLGLAASDGWEPSFYIDPTGKSDQESGRPACPVCCMVHLDYAANGEPTLKAGHVVPSR